MVAAQEIIYKHNLLERIGGTSNLDFLIISFCERIQDDSTLKKFYGNFDLPSLIVFQKELLMAALVEPATESDAENLRTRAALRHYALFERGLNKTHFDMLAVHFSGSLRDCWLNDDVVADCEKCFGELRPMFKEHGKTVKMMADQSKDDHDRLSESMRETIAHKAIIKDFDRLCRSEEFLSKSSSQPQKKKNFMSFLQKNKRKV